MLPSDQVTMPIGRKNEEKQVQNNEGREKVWERLHSDYQGVGGTGEKREAKEGTRKEAGTKQSRIISKCS